MKLLLHPKLQRLHRKSLEMDKKFHDAVTARVIPYSYSDYS